ncbi:MAG: chemotaxis protein CheW, partial [Pseudomonadota bacterium]|nr:chemotaxis protein CheW [Pseudomonadota bacterium]
MSEILSSVDQRTKLVGENRLELLLFRLGTRHTYAINVFKVKEVITVPKMNMMPGTHDNLRGVTIYRGLTIPVIDLRQAIRMRPVNADNSTIDRNVIITEYNRSVQGFMIGDVVSIVNTSWEDIQPPPKSIGKTNFLTAITQIDIQGKRELVEIIDVEKVLAEIIEYDVTISAEILDQAVVEHLKGRKVLIVDDSSTARKQIRDT